MLSFPEKATDSPNRPIIERREDGTWVYDGTPIPVVGARDITLAEILDPEVLGRQGREPTAVLLPLSDLIENSRLNWVLQAGTKLDGDEEPLFKVPWSVWQERAAEPVTAWLPEYDANGLDRALATVEREVRFRKQALDEAVLLRLQILVLATRVGRSRREVGKVVGLSPGRVQQLNDDPPDEVVEEVEEFVAAARRVAAAIGTEACPREEIPRPRGMGADQLDEVVDSMLFAGLVDETPVGLRLTDDGRLLTSTLEQAGGTKRSTAARKRNSDAMA